MAYSIKNKDVPEFKLTFTCVVDHKYQHNGPEYSYHLSGGCFSPGTASIIPVAIPALLSPKVYVNQFPGGISNRIFNFLLLAVKSAEIQCFAMLVMIC